MSSRFGTYLETMKLAKAFFAQAQDYQQRGNDDLALKNLVGAVGYMMTAMNNVASIGFGQKPRKKK